MAAGFRSEVLTLLSSGRSIGETASQLNLEIRQIENVICRDFDGLRFPIPKWVPAKLHDDYRAVALEDGEHAAAAFARREIRSTGPAAVRAAALPTRIEISLPEPEPAAADDDATARYLDVMREFEAEEHSVRSVLRVVAAASGIPVSDIIGPRKFVPVVRARQLADYLCHVVLRLSAPKVGRAIGGRDHTSTLNSVRRVQRVMAHHRVSLSDNVVVLAEHLLALDWAVVPPRRA